VLSQAAQGEARGSEETALVKKELKKCRRELDDVKGEMSMPLPHPPSPP